MRRLAIFTGCATLLFANIPAAHAQRLTVQEPTLETFGVGTTVSVPDRGRLSVAGSGRSATSRSTFGPARSGTNLGMSNQGSGLGIGVHIHDMQETDRRILAEADRSRSSRTKVELSASADRAYETLRNRAAMRAVAQSDSALSSAAAAGHEAKPEKTATADGPSPEKLLDRARQAELDGKRGLALAYLRTARGLGSIEAQHEIDRLAPKKK